MIPYILINLNVYTGKRDGEFLPGCSIWIEGNKIKQVGYFSFPQKAKIIDMKGKYAVPGLINLHAHLPGSGKPSKNPNSAKRLISFIEKHPSLNWIGVKLGKSNAKKALLNGVTTIRAVGGALHFDTLLKNKTIRNDKCPRLFVADYAIATQGGHMVGTVSKPVINVNEAIKLVDDLHDHNVDFIKIMITGGVLDGQNIGHPGELKMSQEIADAIVNKAHEYNLSVAAHVESNEGVKVALKAKVDTIEHAADLDDEDIKIAKDNKTTFISTFSPALPGVFLSYEETMLNYAFKYNASIIIKNTVEWLKKCKDNDIKIGMGSDAGCPLTSNYNFYKELVFTDKLMHFEKEYTLYLATLNNAEILKQDKNIGSIEEGKFADLVITNKNPIDDFENLNRPFMVIKNGKRFKHPHFKHSKDIDKKVNKINGLLDLSYVEKVLKHETD